MVKRNERGGVGQKKSCCSLPLPFVVHSNSKSYIGGRIINRELATRARPYKMPINSKASFT